MQFLNCVSHLEDHKDMISHERFKELIMENWRDFCESIQHSKMHYNLSETEVADLNLAYDKRFEEYYEKVLKEEAKYILQEAQR